MVGDCRLAGRPTPRGQQLADAAAPIAGGNDTASKYLSRSGSIQPTEVDNHPRPKGQTDNREKHADPIQGTTAAWLTIRRNFYVVAWLRNR
jgi:hypothetical protein